MLPISRPLLHVTFLFSIATLGLVVTACIPEVKGDGGHTEPPVIDGGSLCGNGALDGTEECDDGNSRSLDGCSSSCKKEPGFTCGNAGVACTFTPECGDGFLEASESCDDNNKVSGDGCSSTCQLEPGYVCPEEGVTCQAAECGDGKIAGSEICDDGNKTNGDGCDSNCQYEKGFKCDAPGQPCTPAVCGNHIKEGSEQCDDGNNDMGDGCAPDCTAEPHCVNGVCDVVCGDGVLLPSEQNDPEACDDGNVRNGDGCSSTCKRERDFKCDYALVPSPDKFIAPVVYRDFCGDKDNQDSLCGHGISHPDFQSYSGSVRTTGLVKDTLDSENKVAFLSDTGTQNGVLKKELTSEADFKEWYRDGPRNKTKVTTLELPRQANGSYVFDTTAFFPIDDFGWVTLPGYEPVRSGHNFSFTSEVRYWFEYKGTEVLSFRGDDDVWVFINRKLVMDLGGLHPPDGDSVTLSTKASALGLTVGGIYEVVVWQAERHTTGSNYRLTLNNFETRHSICKSKCGNGVTDKDEGEECDDGNNVSGDGCSATCHGELN